MIVIISYNDNIVITLNEDLASIMMINKMKTVAEIWKNLLMPKGIVKVKDYQRPRNFMKIQRNEIYRKLELINCLFGRIFPQTSNSYSKAMCRIEHGKQEQLLQPDSSRENRH